MSGLILLFVILIAVLLWFRPILKRHKEVGGYADKKAIIKAFVYGLLPATIVLLLCQIALGWLLKFIGIDKYPILKVFVQAILMYGCIEELTKYLFARLSMKGYEKFKKIDVMVLFGLVGMGYEVMETMFASNVVAGIIRGIFIAHIVYQLIMGHYYFESVYAKNNGDIERSKKYATYALLIPILIHSLNDIFAGLLGEYSETVDFSSINNVSYSTLIIFFGLNILLIVLNGVCLFWGLKLAKKDPEKEITL